MESKNMLYYESVGLKSSETTLVFLHGSTMTKEGMLGLAKEFPNYNCIVFDLTAHGKSAGEEPEIVDTFAEDVEYSIRQLQQQHIATKRVVLLGYSMGGAITCEIAIRKNLELAGIVFLSSGGNLKDYTPLVDNLKSMPAEQFRTDDILEYLFGSNTPKQETEKIEKLFATTKVADTIGYGDLMASNRYDHLDACNEIQIPTLLVHGNDDKIVLPMAAVETWKRIPNCQLLMIPYKGHAAIYEDTTTVKNGILDFIAQCK
ncbi:MAG: alpha/beta hydrolase [Lachnospiraceae bacterium]|nr:alpha/beta hydrolase [Lachnospiraceae bacterium]